MRLYQVKINNGYVKGVFIAFNEIQITPDIRKMKHIGETEKDFVLSVFPEAEIKMFDVVEDKSYLA